MADTKLSDLTELATKPASDDELYIRDISEAAANESKRITVANLMAASDAGEGHITILPLSYVSIGQGTWAIGLTTSQWLNGYLNATSQTDGDNISYKVYLAAGTYTLRILSVNSASGGIIDIDIDATEVASFDYYAAATAYNVALSQTGIVIATSGLKTLKVRIDGKHASSSNYSVWLSYIALWRTA